MKALCCEKSSFVDKEGKQVYMLVLAEKDKNGIIRVNRKADASGKYVLVKNEVVPAEVFDKVFPCKCYNFTMGLSEGSRYARITGAEPITAL